MNLAFDPEFRTYSVSLSPRSRRAEIRSEFRAPILKSGLEIVGRDYGPILEDPNELLKGSSRRVRHSSGGRGFFAFRRHLDPITLEQSGEVWGEIGASSFVKDPEKMSPILDGKQIAVDFYLRDRSRNLLRRPELVSAARSEARGFKFKAHDPAESFLKAISQSWIHVDKLNRLGPEWDSENFEGKKVGEKDWFRSRHVETYAQQMDDLLEGRIEAFIKRDPYTRVGSDFVTEISKRLRGLSERGREIFVTAGCLHDYGYHDLPDKAAHQKQGEKIAVEFFKRFPATSLVVSGTVIKTVMGHSDPWNLAKNHIDTKTGEMALVLKPDSLEEWIRSLIQVGHLSLQEIPGFLEELEIIFTAISAIDVHASGNRHLYDGKALNAPGIYPKNIDPREIQSVVGNVLSHVRERILEDSYDSNKFENRAEMRLSQTVGQAGAKAVAPAEDLVRGKQNEIVRAFDASIESEMKKIKQRIPSADIVILFPFYNEIQDVAVKHGALLPGTHGQTIDIRDLARTIHGSLHEILKRYGLKQALVLCVGETANSMAVETLAELEKITQGLEDESVKFEVYGKEKQFAGLIGKKWATRLAMKVAREIGADLASVDGDMQIDQKWLGKLLEPVLTRKASYASPRYVRYYGKDDIAIIDHFVFPIFSSFFGTGVRMPNAGEFGVSKDLLQGYLDDSDIWMGEIPFEGCFASGSIVQGKGVADVWAGEKTHKANPLEKNLEKYFGGVLRTLFEQISNHPEWWRSYVGSDYTEMSEGGGLPEGQRGRPAKEVYADLSGPSGEANGIDRAVWIRTFKKEYQANREAYRHDFPVLVSKLDGLVQSNEEEFVFTAKDWAFVVMSFIRKYLETKDKQENLQFATLLKPIFMARVASFVGEVENLTMKKAEELLQQQAKDFAVTKNSFWGSRFEMYLNSVDSSTSSPQNVGRIRLALQADQPAAEVGRRAEMRVLSEEILESQGQVIADFLAVREEYLPGKISQEARWVPVTLDKLALDPQKKNLAMIFGSWEERPAYAAADVILQLKERGYGITVLTSGQYGSKPGIFYDAQGKRLAEAEHYRNILEAKGIPVRFVEPLSVNTGENVRFSKKLLDAPGDAGFKPDTLILMQNPILQRRAGLSIVRQYFGSQEAFDVSDLRLVSYSPYIPEMKALSDVDLVRHLGYMLTELKSLRKYPDDGHTIPTVISRNVVQAESILSPLLDEIQKRSEVRTEKSAKEVLADVSLRAEDLKIKIQSKKEELKAVLGKAHPDLDRAFFRFDRLLDVANKMLAAHQNKELMDRYFKDVVSPVLRLPAGEMNYLLGGRRFGNGLKALLDGLYPGAPTDSIKKQLQLLNTGTADFWKLNQYFYLDGLPIIVEDEALSGSVIAKLKKAADLIASSGWYHEMKGPRSLESIADLDQTTSRPGKKDVGGVVLGGHALINFDPHDSSDDYAATLIHEDQHIEMRNDKSMENLRATEEDDFEWKDSEGEDLTGFIDDEASFQNTFVHPWFMGRRCRISDLFSELFAYGRELEFLFYLEQQSGAHRGAAMRRYRALWQHSQAAFSMIGESLPFLNSKERGIVMSLRDQVKVLWDSFSRAELRNKISEGGRRMADGETVVSSSFTIRYPLPFSNTRVPDAVLPELKPMAMRKQGIVTQGNGYPQINPWKILRLKQDVIMVVEQSRIDTLSPERFRELLEVVGLNHGKLHLVIPVALQGKYSERVAELRKVASVYDGFPRLAASDKIPVIGFSDMEHDTLAEFQKRLDPRLAERMKDSAFGLNQAGSFGIGILYALEDISRSELRQKNGYFYDAVGRWSTQVLEVLQAYTVISTSA